jgi:ribose-phosphate pyrophosphokinase
VVVSPDVGGIKMARSYAKRFKTPLAIVDKRRISTEDTEVMNILGEVKGKNVIIVDDLVATAGSITEAASALKKAGAKDIYVTVTHPVFSGNALGRIASSPIKKIFVTNTIPLDKTKKHEKIKVLSIAPLLAEAIKRIHKEESISCLFD